MGCRDNIGGIKEVYIGSFTNLEVYTEDTDGTITGVTGNADLHTFELRQQQGSFVQSGNHSIENGTNFYEQVVSIVFTKNDAADRNMLNVLSQSTLLVVVKDNNGTYFLIGALNGAELTASSQSSGQNYGDMNGTTLSITGRESTPARVIEEAAVIAMKAVA